jgi:hypothetical protein
VFAAMNGTAKKANREKKVDLFRCWCRYVCDKKFPIGPQSLPTPRHRGPTDATPTKCRIDH